MSAPSSRSSARATNPTGSRATPERTGSPVAPPSRVCSSRSAPSARAPLGLCLPPRWRAPAPPPDSRIASGRPPAGSRSSASPGASVSQSPAAPHSAVLGATVEPQAGGGEDRRQVPGVGEPRSAAGTGWSWSVERTEKWLSKSGVDNGAFVTCIEVAQARGCSARRAACTTAVAPRSTRRTRSSTGKAAHVGRDRRSGGKLRMHTPRGSQPDRCGSTSTASARARPDRSPDARGEVGRPQGRIHA
jgi:hypothetical protein